MLAAQTQFPVSDRIVSAKFIIRHHAYSLPAPGLYNLLRDALIPLHANPSLGERL